MLTTQKLNAMLLLQDKMNKKINPDWLHAGYGYLRAAMIESVEGMEHHGWKWWKAQERDLLQLQMELVDIWHFAMSAIIIDSKGDIEHSASAISDELQSDAAIIVFDGKDYDIARQSILDNLELMAGLCAARRFSVSLFLRIVVQAEMDADELFRQYIGKNILNIFRQDYGYKKGTYIKIWHGREDNEHLVEILNELDIDSPYYSERIYQGLADRYPA